MDEPKRGANKSNGTKRVFTCTHTGCGRSFSRSEHLHRHQKNHTEGDATCTRCRAHFKRQDLLERHLSRHRQRDDEAGGEGSGTLNTRKRMWKDYDGNIVQKKPNASEQVADQAENLAVAVTLGAEEPLSPPVSLHNSDPIIDGERVQAFLPEQPNFFAGHSAEAGQYPIQAQGDYWVSPPGNRPQDVVTSDLMNFDTVFQADTASSFNMPYTTQVNYDWLFSMGNNIQDHVEVQAPLPTTSCNPSNPSSQTAWSYGQGTSLNPSQVPLAANFHDPRRHVDYTTTPLPSEAPRTSFREGEIDSSIGWQPLGRSGAAPVANETPRVGFERPLSFLTPQNLPTISQAVYGKLIQTVESARPIAPGGSPLDPQHYLLSHTSVQAYSDLYFTRFNTAYPLIHLATFEPSRTEPLLLLSMILLGATYGEQSAHQLALCIHDVIRPLILAHASFSAKPDLWMLQTILLVECFGKSRADQKQHDMSHLFHGMLINLIRRSDCQSVHPSRPGPRDHHGDPAHNDESWRKWVESEEKKRLALLCFLWDTQHAVLFCQSLCMSAFELRLPLLCDQRLWEAPTATAWVEISRCTPPEPMYLLALKSYLANNAPRDSHLNALSRIIVFHGLMSIFWDMQRRDQTSLGVISSQGGRWQHRVETAYRAWKTDFDVFCASLSEVTATTTSTARDRRPEEEGVGSGDHGACSELERWRVAYLTVYHSAVVLLHSDFLDIQVYAGARHILGRPVQRSDFLRSEKVVRRWANMKNNNNNNNNNSDGANSSAANAAWHATRMLEIFLVDAPADGGRHCDNDTGLFHVPWCFYLATLTTWAYHHAGARSFGDDGGGGGSELVWDADAEMRALVSSMVAAGVEGLPSVQGVKRTGPLIWVMANVLSKVRWGIVHAGVAVLHSLIPRRLFGQLERNPWQEG
ncbi:fungal-specific transcription factor domain-containing protein [Xylariomycetidae sp. FL2044]|nr:fungal-specific transcription factor domain-containing protein [Xylariomycetidae sp. FL2044]